MAKEARFFATIAGVSYRNPDGSSRQELLKKCERGDILVLRREPDNPYGPMAIAVHRESGEQLGYIRKEVSACMAPLMDGGVQFTATVDSVGEPEGASLLGCAIDIYARSDDDEPELHRVERLANSVYLRKRRRGNAYEPISEADRKVFLKVIGICLAVPTILVFVFLLLAILLHTC